MTHRSRFITLEGGEGGGKSTQARRLADWLTARGHEVELTREPGGTAGAEEIRRLLVEGGADRWEPMSELLLLAAARREHVVRRIRPALAAGRWVVCDRFVDSTLAYQGHGHGLGADIVRRLHRLSLESFMPDLTLILDLPPATGLARTGGRTHAETRFERMGAAFHERVRQGFHEIAAAEPGRCVLIAAAGPEAQIAAEIAAAVTARLDGAGARGARV